MERRDSGDEPTRFETMDASDYILDPPSFYAHQSAETRRLSSLSQQLQYDNTSSAVRFHQQHDPTAGAATIAFQRERQDHQQQHQYYDNNYERFATARHYESAVQQQLEEEEEELQQHRHHRTIESDMTSTAGYTLSGNYNRRQRFQQTQQQLLYDQQQQLLQQQLQTQHGPESQRMLNSAAVLPESSRSLSTNNFHDIIIHDDILAYRIDKLRSQGFTIGLAKALIMNADSFDQRIWIVDNSGSMEIDDGQKIVVRDDGRVDIKTGVSRWEELQDTVVYHAEIAATIGSYTCFRLLNDPGRVVGRKEVVVGCRADDGHLKSMSDLTKDVQQVRRAMMKVRPDGVTPLTEHIRSVEIEIREMLPKLQASGKRVAVILATDGLPSDPQGYGGPEITQEFVESLRALEGLPVWMVIRLCTDEDDVREFYNDLDNLLDFSLEVLDDFRGEFIEVVEMNSWLNYSLPIHRCRELGYHDRLFDLIDERPLTKGELREFCSLLFGTEFDAIPDAVTDWEDFISYIEEKLIPEQMQWNPVQKRMRPWIDVRKLKKIYGPKSAIQKWMMKKIHVKS